MNRLILTILLIISASCASFAEDIRPLPEYIKASIPNTYVNLVTDPSGLSEILWSVQTAKDITVNRECTETVKLFLEDKLIIEVSAEYPEDDDTPGVLTMNAGMFDDDIPTSGNIVRNVGFFFGNISIVDAGKYTLSIPEGFFMYGQDQPMPEGVKYYYITEPAVCNPANNSSDISPAELNKVSITFTGIKTIEPGQKKTIWGKDYSTAKLKILFSNIDIKDKYDWVIDGNTVTFSLKDGEQLPNESGVFKITISQGFFFNAEDRDAAYAVTYKVNVKKDDLTTSVENISKNPQNITVFNLNGQKLLDGTPADRLESLPEGIYVVNGKKIFK